VSRIGSLAGRLAAALHGIGSSRSAMSSRAAKLAIAVTPREAGR
jgi:hypothetical protein